MNDLEREYLQNVERTKRRDQRRWLATMAIFYSVAPVGFCIYLAADDFSVRGAIRAIPLLAFFGVALAIRSAIRVGPGLLKRLEDRRVEVTSTERERTYREPIATNERAPRPTPPIVFMVAMIPLGVAAVALGVLLNDPHSRRVSYLEAYGVIFVLGGIILVGQHVYRAWRTRRNARLELEWEKWLDSADSCEVGPRKWTK